MEVKDKVVAITGASRGIGAVTARLLAAQGAHVVLAGRDTDALDALASSIAADGGEAVARTCDVTRAEEMTALVELAVQRFGGLDVLVANAGVAINGSFTDGELADWDTMIDVNLRGVLHGIAAALPVFSRQGRGHFVTVTSTAAQKWVPGQGVYAATKVAVRAACEVLRQEVGPEIRATIVSPGFTNTGFIDSTRDPAEHATLAARRDAIALDPAEVAETIAFAIGRPPGVDVGEIVVRSAAQP